MGPNAVKQERRHREAVQALTALEGFGYQARLAGGCVRDRLLAGRGIGDGPVDYDIATTARPEDVTRHFQAAGRRTVPTGLDHGTITLLMPAGPVEITTLRTDVATDGRHAQVAFGMSFEDDAARRDFTINAMFEDARGAVYDYHGGKDDLDAGVLRFVGDPALRMREDFLRILRLFRFWSRFGFAPAPGTLAAVAAEGPGLARISQERITAELVKTCAGKHADAALGAMAQSGIFQRVLPEIRNGLPPPQVLGAWRTALPEPGIAVLGGLAVLSGLDSAAAGQLGVRLKLSVADQRRLAFLPFAAAALARPLPEIADRLELVDAAESGAGPSGAWTDFYAPVLATMPALAKNLASVNADETRHGARRRAKLPLDGNAVAAALKLTPGPALGEHLARLRRAFRNGEWTTRDEGLAWLEAVK